MNRKWLTAGTIGLSLLSASPSYATEGYARLPAVLAKTESAILEYQDNVSGGCLPNPGQATDALRLELMRSGFKFQSEGPDLINVSFNGYKHELYSGVYLCVIQFEVTVQHWVYANLAYYTGDTETAVPVISYSEAGIYTVSPADAQELIEDKMSDIGKHLSVEWLKLRQPN